MTRDKNDWPYPLMGIMWKTKDFKWLEVSKEIYWNQLEGIFPMRMKHQAFAMGEPFTHANDNIPVTSMFVIIDDGGTDRYFARMDKVTNFKPFDYREEILAQLLTQ